MSLNSGGGLQLVHDTMCSNCFLEIPTDHHDPRQLLHCGVTVFGQWNCGHHPFLHFAGVYDVGNPLVTMGKLANVWRIRPACKLKCYFFCFSVYFLVNLVASFHEYKNKSMKKFLGAKRKFFFIFFSNFAKKQQKISIFSTYTTKYSS